MQYTTEYLIQLIKERETIPDSGAAYSDDVLLRYLDQSLKGFIVPAIESVLEEHFVVTMDFQMPIQASTNTPNPPVNVANTIEIPGESSGLRLRDVYVVGNDGSFFNLPRLTPTQAAAQAWGSPWGPNIPVSNQNFVGGFYLQGNTLQIYPYGLASGKTFRITFQRSPANLCLTEDAGMVTNVSGDVVTIDRVQANWFGNITNVDVIKGDAPNDYAQDVRDPVTVYTSYTPLRDVTLVSVSGNVLTFPTGSAFDIEEGDWICPNTFSVFPQNIPLDLMPALVQKAAQMCIHAAGDTEGNNVAGRDFADLLAMGLKLITPRVIGKPQKILPTNSPFRASRSSGFGRW